NGIRHAVRFRSPVMIDQQVPRQPSEPYSKRSLGGAKTPQRPKHPHENFLGQILRLGIRAHKTIADPIHAPGMDFYQVLPGALIARYTPLDNSLIGVHVGFTPSERSPKTCGNARTPT